MPEVYVVRNQLGHYWGKGKAWVDGTDPKAVLRLKHEDEAINALFELSSKDVELRGEVLAVELSEKGAPVVEPSEHLLPKEVAEEEATASAEDTPDDVSEEPKDAAAKTGDESTSATLES